MPVLRRPKKKTALSIPYKISDRGNENIPYVFIGKDGERHMIMVWRCECGAEIPEPGNRDGYKDATLHRQMHKSNGEEYNIIGLFDVSTGEELASGFGPKTLQAAQMGGYIAKADPPKKRKKDKEKKDRDDDEDSKSGVSVVKMPPHVISIPWETDVFFRLACLVHPEYEEENKKGADIGYGKYLHDCARYTHQNYVMPILLERGLGELVERLKRIGAFEEVEDILMQIGMTEVG